MKVISYYDKYLHICTIKISCFHIMPPDFERSCAKRFVMKREVSIKRSTQLAMQVSVRESSLLPGVPTHVSQHISFILCIIDCICAFCCSIMRKDCSSASFPPPVLLVVLPVSRPVLGEVKEVSLKEDDPVSKLDENPGSEEKVES